MNRSCNLPEFYGGTHDVQSHGMFLNLISKITNRCKEERICRKFGPTEKYRPKSYNDVPSY